MSGGPRKGNFIHVYNASALDPELETLATSGSETTLSLDSPRSLGSQSDDEPPRDVVGLGDGNEDVGNNPTEGVARSRNARKSLSDASSVVPHVPHDSIAQRPTHPPNLFAFVQQWYRQFACCCVANSADDVLGYTRPLNLNRYDELCCHFAPGELVYAPTPLDVVSECDVDGRSRRLHRPSGDDDASPLRAKDGTCAQNEEEKKEAPANSQSTSSTDATSTDETDDISVDLLPGEVLPDIDALVSRVDAFLELRRKFERTFADVRQGEGTSMGGFLVLDSIATPSRSQPSPITSSFRSFIRSCLWHFDADKVLPTGPARGTLLSATFDHTQPILCASMEEMDVLLSQIRQRIDDTADVTLTGLANNVRSYSRYTHYPSIILTIHDARSKDDQDADGDNVYCVELHHATLYAIQQEHRTLYQPFAIMAGSPHATILDRLFTAEEECLAEFCRMLRVQSQNLESLRGLRVLRALLAGEPDNGALGEYILARMVDVVDMDEEGTEPAVSQQVHNAYARVLHRKATRLSQGGKERMREAERTFAMALQAVRPLGCRVESPLILHDFAIFHEQHGHLDEAVRLFTRALESHDGSRPSAKSRAASSTDMSRNGGRLIDTAHRLCLLLRQQGKVAECATLCAQWDLSMEDIERELRRVGKLPPIEGASVGVTGKQRRLRKCLLCGVAKRP
eukprot:GEMP01005232.1.p1 GENE.GEMP01005232.1~~GEMP01005232.1.p1  ORF type:complete len:684 (-),score=178.23 GEMP01005232.1:1919-3970(-)